MAARSKLAVILHADVVGSTALVRKDEGLAHDRIQAAFQLFSEALQGYGGTVHEIRGDALVAEFSRASDAVIAALAAQKRNVESNAEIIDEVVPQIRVGIALGEVVIADQTLTGAGVILAQRLEQLAEPGGICISAAVREAVPDRLALGYSDLGAHEAKGFDERVVAYSVALKLGEVLPEPTLPVVEPGLGRAKWQWFSAIVVVVMVVGGGVLSWLQPWEPDVERADPDKMAYALPDRPSIAVLPFDSLSTDKEQEFFADAITEDIITDLSKISGLFVVARDSSFTYKGGPVKLRRVAEELGVRHILEGTVQRSESQLRITAQLVDAVKGNHLWAERYDREFKELFSVQSEVAQKVAKALAVTLTANENERLFQKYTSSIDAYEVYLRARRTANSPSRSNIELGEKLFGRVIELDPKFAGGYAGLSFVHSVKARFKYGPSPASDRLRALELAKKAVAVDRDFAWAHIALAGAHLSNGDPVAAVDTVRQALALEPNGYDANLFMGLYLQFAGESALAVEHLELAKRLSPVDTVRNLAFLGRGYFMNGDYTGAVRVWTTRYRKFPVSSPNGFVYLAAAYSLLDEPEEAAATVDKLLEAFPKFSLSQWAYINLYKSEADRTRLYNAAKKAGIPEFPRLALPDKPSIAVLAFNNMSDDPEQDYFAEGIAEDIITDLSKVEGLFVIARNSSFAYKGKAISIGRIGRELGVKFVLEGSVRRAGDSVRINAQLIDGQTGGHIWAERYDGSLNDVFGLQDTVTEKVVSALTVTLSPAESAALRARGTADPQAYDAFLTGIRNLNEGRVYQGAESIARAREAFERAIKIDSAFARAYAGLGWTSWAEYAFGFGYTGDRLVKRDRAWRLARQSLELGENALAHRLLTKEHMDLEAHYRWGAETNHEAAIAEARKAISLEPNNADALAELAYILTFAGETEEADQLIARAKRLNPTFPLWYRKPAGMIAYNKGNYETAMSELTAVFESDAFDASTLWLAAATAQAGKLEDARKVLSSVDSMRGTSQFAVERQTPLRNEIDMRHFLEGLGKAGMPEEPKALN